MRRRIVFGAGVCAFFLVACATGSTLDASTEPPGTGSDAGGSPPLVDPGAEAGVDVSDASAASDGAASAVDSLGANRDRLRETYFDFLKSTATTPQSNGLSAADITNVCDVWAKLEPSGRDVFLTLTARMQGSVLGSDGSSMLRHVLKVYRIVGGQSATTGDPGSCGGGESNRMIMSMDATLHDAQVAASAHHGARQSSGAFDIADAPSGSAWHDSQDIGGPHAPFDVSDETVSGAPRAQTQYFADPTTAAAKAPLGRQDLATLVDPYALEMDHDYDCTHNSNPDCSYTFYGPACAPETTELATSIYAASYGDFVAAWKPTGCP